jgi:hypothetical protein
MSDRRRYTIIDAIDDRNLFAGWFHDRATWSAWFTFLRSLFGYRPKSFSFIASAPVVLKHRQHQRQKAGTDAPGNKANIENWAKQQPDRPSRSEAIPRLVEIALSGKPNRLLAQKATFPFSTSRYS